MTQRIQPPRGPFDGVPDNRLPPDSDGGLRAPPGLGPWGQFWWWLKFWLFVKTARLRFIVILVAIGLVILKWNLLMAYYERWTRALFPASGQEAAGADTEFWCPMHPTVIRDHADKCPICGMPLSQRKKGEVGEGEALPPGVVTRVQLTPYRVALAGIKTWEVAYQPLSKEMRTVGFVEFDERKLARISAKVTGKSRIDKLYVNVTGQHVSKGEPLAELYNPDLVTTVDNLLDAHAGGRTSDERAARTRLRRWGITDEQIDALVKAGKPITNLTLRAPISGHIIKKYQVEGEIVEEGARLYDVADLSTVWVEAQVYEDELAYLKEGLPVHATTKAFPNRVFEGNVAFVHPHLDAATRTLRVRFDLANPSHELRPGMYATVSLKVPATQLDLFTRALDEDWRNELLRDGLARALTAPGGLAADVGLEPLTRAAVRRVLSARGQVLAVPESAVIDTGSRKFVYREAWPGAYDGVQVELGPRCGDFYPVVRGLEAGDRVVTAGSFLVDAETRLTSGVGSTYFGASGGPQSERRSSASEARPSMSEDEDAKISAVLAKLSRVDRRLAEAQGYCPVLERNRLGSMGVPVKIVLNGQPVFLCCSGCEKEAREHAERTLARVERLKTSPKASDRPNQAAKTPAAGTDAARQAEAEIQTNLAKLKPEDRRLAEAQRFCAVQQENRLGSMGVPVKVMVKGRPVFLCCDGCEREALDHSERTLAAVEKLKGRKR
jgi:Cu(I)/Ag(I) efflux system membrane fusion protein